MHYFAFLGKITVIIDANTNVKEANAWYAYSCGYSKDNTTRRDFRKLTLDSPCLCGSINLDYGFPLCYNQQAMWRKQQIQPRIINGTLTYEVSFADFDPPSTNPMQWLAFMLEFKLENPYGLFINGTDVHNKGKMYLVENIDDLDGYFDFTTEAIIWPNEYPYKDCLLDSCGTTLI